MLNYNHFLSFHVKRGSPWYILLNILFISYVSPSLSPNLTTKHESISDTIAFKSKKAIDKNSIFPVFLSKAKRNLFLWSSPFCLFKFSRLPSYNWSHLFSNTQSCHILKSTFPLYKTVVVFLFYYYYECNFHCNPSSTKYFPFSVQAPFLFPSTSARIKI